MIPLWCTAEWSVQAPGNTSQPRTKWGGESDASSGLSSAAAAPPAGQRRYCTHPPHTRAIVTVRQKNVILMETIAAYRTDTLIEHISEADINLLRSLQPNV